VQHDTSAEYVQNNGYPAETVDGETVRITGKVTGTGQAARETQILVSEDGRYFAPTKGNKVEEVSIVGELPAIEPAVTETVPAGLNAEPAPEVELELDEDGDVSDAETTGNSDDTTTNDES
jgi:hypothetical protein